MPCLLLPHKQRKLPNFASCSSSPSSASLELQFDPISPYLHFLGGVGIVDEVELQPDAAMTVVYHLFHLPFCMYSKAVQHSVLFVCGYEFPKCITTQLVIVKIYYETYQNKDLEHGSA